MKGRQLVIRAWMLPLLVVALVLPATAAFVVAGPGLGLAVGALAATGVLIVAALHRPDEPIEVAHTADDRRHLLLVVIEPLDQPAGVEAMRAAVGADPSGNTEVLALAPALNTRLEEWASDLGRARLDAQRKLVLTIGALAAGEVEARGAVGDPDPLQAVEDTLRDFPADEVIVADLEGPPQGEYRRLLGELRRRLDRPVYRLSAGAAVGLRS
jgi:hypothetical protein